MVSHDAQIDTRPDRRSDRRSDRCSDRYACYGFIFYFFTSRPSASSFHKTMSEKQLTKVVCSPADSNFVVMYLRWKQYELKDLNLQPFNKSFKIFDYRIKNDLIAKYKEYKELKISLEDFFQRNIIYATCKRRNDEFTLRQTTFDPEKEVSDWYLIGTKFIRTVSYGKYFRRSFYYAINTDTASLNQI